MTKKDFQLIAGVLASTPLRYDNPEHARLRLAEEFARALSEGNSRFKRDLFIQAAMGQVSVTARKARKMTPAEDAAYYDARRNTGKIMPSDFCPKCGGDCAGLGYHAPEARTIASDLAEDR